MGAGLAGVAGARGAGGDGLGGAGRADEAAIIEVGALIAADPALVEPAVADAMDGDAATAVRRAAQAQAEVLESLPVPELAQRADDIRQIASAVIAQLSAAQLGPAQVSGTRTGAVAVSSAGDDGAEAGMAGGPGGQF